MAQSKFKSRVLSHGDSNLEGSGSAWLRSGAQLNVRLHPHCGLCCHQSDVDIGIVFGDCHNILAANPTEMEPIQNY